MIDWEIHGMEFTNCNCAYGCPCQFNALPTHGNCQAICFLRIDRGHFGQTRLDGLKMAFAVSWPGAVHQGNGKMQPILDGKADQDQRTALHSILTGKETAEAATYLWIYAAMCDKIFDPIVTDIDIQMDMTGRTAHCKAAGAADGRGEPIRNPVTGKEHRAGILLPNGLEYGQNECGRGWSTSSGAVALAINDSYAHWCEIHLNGRGRIK
jgi:hypothetical protein